MTVHEFPSPGGCLKLSEIPERPALQPWYSGFPEWRSNGENKIALAPGTLSVVTGHPGHGKSTLMGNIIFNTASINELVVAVVAAENYPKPSYRKMLRQFWAGMRQDQMTDAMMREADDFIEAHYRFLMHPEENPTISWVLDWANINNPDILLIDPWNRLESQQEKDETETKYILWALIELRKFAARRNCHVMVIAHPAKRPAQFRAQEPYLEDISGSKHWDNIPDQGFVVHRADFSDKQTGRRCYDVNLTHAKAREEELGYICRMPMKLNPQTCRFDVGSLSHD